MILTEKYMLLFSLNFISFCFKLFFEHYYTPGRIREKKKNKIMNEYIFNSKLA